MNTCVVTKNYDLIVMPTRKFRLLNEYKYKHNRYHTDPEFRRKCIDKATEWRRNSKKPKPIVDKEPVFRIQVRQGNDLKTVFELS